jgi:hypothetical protein
MSNLGLIENLGTAMNNLAVPYPYAYLDEKVEYAVLKKDSCELNINTLQHVKPYRASKPILPVMNMQYNLPSSRRLYENDFVGAMLKSKFSSLGEEVYIEAYNSLEEIFKECDEESLASSLYRGGFLKFRKAENLAEVISELEGFGVSCNDEYYYEDQEDVNVYKNNETQQIFISAYPLTNDSEIAGEMEVLESIVHGDDFHSVNLLFSMKGKEGRVPEEIKEETFAKLKEYVVENLTASPISDYYKIVSKHDFPMVCDPCWMEGFQENDGSLSLDFDYIAESVRVDCKKSGDKIEAERILRDKLTQHALHIAEGMLEMVCIGVVSELLFANFSGSDEISSFIFELCDGIHEILKDSGELVYG